MNRLLCAVIEGDVATVTAEATNASPEQRQRAMEAAVHWGDAACVTVLMPYCDVAAALAFVDDRDRVEPEGLRTQPEVFALLLARRLDVCPAVLDASPIKRRRL